MKDLQAKINCELIRRGLVDDFAGHDLCHHARVAQMAKKLYSEEGTDGDLRALLVSALVHDVHRLMMPKDGTEKFTEPAESVSMITEILKAAHINLSIRQMQLVSECVKRHEEYDDTTETFVELALLQDADNLDALGLVGLVRTIQYGGRYKQPFFADDIHRIDYSANYIEGSDPSQSILSHIKSKLFRLEGYMNTESAKLIARNRIDQLDKLVSECEKEWGLWT